MTIQIRSELIEASLTHHQRYVVVGKHSDTVPRISVFNGTSWSSWVTMPGLIAQEPSCAIFNNRLYVSACGITPGPIYIGWFNLSTLAFSGWETLPSGGSPSSHSLVVAYGKLFLFVRGYDDNVWFLRFDGTQWEADWHFILGRCDNGVGACFFQGLIYIVRMSAEFNDLYSGTLNAQTLVFTGWTWIPGGATNRPSMTVANDKLWLFVRGSDGIIYYKTSNGAAWDDNWTIPWASVSLTGGPSVSTYEDNIMVTFTQLGELQYGMINSISKVASSLTVIGGGIITLVSLAQWIYDPRYSKGPYYFESDASHLLAVLMPTAPDDRVTLMTTHGPVVLLDNYNYLQVKCTGTTNARVLLRFFCQGTPEYGFDVIYWGTPQALNALRFNLIPQWGHTIRGDIYLGLISSDMLNAWINITEIALFSPNALLHGPGLSVIHENASHLYGTLEAKETYGEMAPLGYLGVLEIEQ